MYYKILVEEMWILSGIHMTVRVSYLLLCVDHLSLP